MTREEVKQQLSKNPLVWEEEMGGHACSLHSRVTLMVGEGGGEDDYDALRIDFNIDVNEANRSCSVDVSAYGRWEFGNYELARSRGYIIPLEVLKGKAEDCRLSMACRILGIRD